MKVVKISDEYKESSKEVLEEAISEEPDTAVVLLFWKDRGQFKIKCSKTPDRLMLLGCLVEAQDHVLHKGWSKE